MHSGGAAEARFIEVNGAMREVFGNDTSIKIAPRNQGKIVTPNLVAEKEK